MNKKLYYTVERELERINDTLKTTGFKTITMYSIDNNVPEKIGDLYIENEGNSIDMMDEYLSDNGYGDESFDFILL